MANEVKKGKLFIKQVLSKIKGDNQEELAAKIARKAVSAVESQLAALRANEVDLEGDLEDAAELLDKALYPIEMITSGQEYISGIQRAHDAKAEAQEELEEVKESIIYFEALLASF